ncbi:MAG: MliC family protein [Patescibacteria group bacterium]|nr:MliC family protein [Patescibacteria group bacterium]MDD4663268.1 MliC family protein [Caldisericia bacterium]
MPETSNQPKKILMIVVVVSLFVAFVWLSIKQHVNQQTIPAPINQESATTTTEKKPEQIKATFNCPDGRFIQAIFNNGTTSSVDLVLSDGRAISLPQVISASGARYANADESFVFWNKGDSAFITENGTTTFENCFTNYTAATSTEPIDYVNQEFDFVFTLPTSWQGYSIINDTWKGYAVSEKEGQTLYAQGPEIFLRHPLWTKEVPHQDIPIMIFTLAQWDDLLAEKFHIGAAPIGPSELGRNADYVFALPARYNYAFPTGYEEVDQIIQGKPLK